MRTRWRWFPVYLAAIALVMPAGARAEDASEESAGSTPEAVVVQHCLVGFKRSVPGKKIPRTKAEARKLAEEIHRRALEGEDFDALVKEYTDDSYPGILAITDRGAPIRAGYRSRDQLVPGFGDTAFELDVGEFGLVPWHGYKSPYGWHVILRLE